MITKDQARTMIRALIPDEEKQAISDGILDLACQLNIDELMGDILDEAPWFRSQVDVITTFVAPGFIDLTPAGPLTKRFYRTQKFTRAGTANGSSQEYTPTSQHDTVTFNQQDVSSYQFTYWVSGEQFFAFPLDTTTTAELRYSYLPVPYTTLLGSANVDWPDGFENVFIYETAARLTQDQNLSQKYHAVYNAANDRMMSRIRREFVGPSPMLVSESPMEWGGT